MQLGDIRRVIEHLCDTENPLNRMEHAIEEILDETLGFGPLEPLLETRRSAIFSSTVQNCYVEHTRQARENRSDLPR
jgi:pilus assembly protein CpaF